MTNTETKTYNVGVIERAIAYYDVEAEDARTAAENWSDGEFKDRDDEAIDSEGPCNVRERQSDGTWRIVPPCEWENKTAAADASPQLLAACRMVVDRWERGDLAEAARACSDAVAEAESTRFFPARGDDDVNHWHGNAQGMATILRGARRLILDMGRIIRGLDENNEWLEFWTNDGEYLCCDSRYDNLVAILAHAGAAVPPSASDPAKKPYSVLLLYPDYTNDTGTETYYAFVEAADPFAAVAAAQRRALATNEWDDMSPSRFTPLLVIEGHHYGQPIV